MYSLRFLTSKSFFYCAITAARTVAQACTGITVKEFLDTFEDKPSGAQVGLEGNLKYENFKVQASGTTANVGGLVPTSQSNVANGGTDLLSETNNSYQLPSISTAGTNVSSFDLVSFYWGCSLASPVGAAGVPVGCDLVVTGYNPSEGQKRPVTFGFAPPSGALVADLSKATLPTGLVTLTSVTFGISVSGVEPALTSLLIDNVITQNEYFVCPS